jgi:membrane-associated protein
MDLGPVSKVFDFIVHIDKYLNYVIESFGLWSYAIFSLIIFAETGLVVTPFLPGDSLLFVIGAFAAAGSLNVVWTFLILTFAAALGNTVNYAIGKKFGGIILKHEGRFFIKKEHIDRTYRFYDKYGAKTIVLARFMPIVRTFAPFVAGIGRMKYRTFLTYNFIGSSAWVAVCVFSGYWFGNIPIIKKNFELVIIGIIFVSFLPVIIHLLQEKIKKNKPL